MGSEQEELFVRIEDFVTDYEWDEMKFGDLLRQLDEIQRENNSQLQSMAKLQGCLPGGKYGVHPVDMSAFKNLDMRSYEGETVKEWKSSGTTGSRSVAPLHDTEMYDLAISTCQFGTGFFNRLHQVGLVLVLVPRSYDWPTSSLAYMFGRIVSREAGRKTYYAVVEHGDRPGDLKLDKTFLHELFEKPTKTKIGILTTSYMGIKLMEEIQTELAPGSFILDTGGYKGVVRDHSREEFIELAQERLGLPKEQCFSEYGMSEMSSQLWSRWIDGEEYWRVPQSVDIEVLDPDEDGVGQVVVYDLLNVWSTCAMKTQDLGKLYEIDGRRYFQPKGRMAKADVKGCSITAERAFNA